MPVTITGAADSPVLDVLGEELRPLTPGGQGLSVEVFETSAPGEAPGQAGPPPHRHPWDEIYVVLDGILKVFDGRPGAKRGLASVCACPPISGTPTATAPRTAASSPSPGLAAHASFSRTRRPSSRRLRIWRWRSP
jgi:hypothetical protein